MPVKIPIDAHIITLLVLEEPQPSKWKAAFVKQVVEASNDYWTKTAGISFFLRSCKEEEAVELPGGSSLINDSNFFFLRMKYPPQKDNSVSLLLVNAFDKNSNLGKAVESLTTCAISYYTSSVKANADNLSHELGHLLSLPHVTPGKDAVKTVSNLMYEGAHLMVLEQSQIKTALSSPLAKRFGGV